MKKFLSLLLIIFISCSQSTTSLDEDAEEEISQELKIIWCKATVNHIEIKMDGFYTTGDEYHPDYRFVLLSELVMNNMESELLGLSKTWVYVRLARKLQGSTPFMDDTERFGSLPNGYYLVYRYKPFANFQAFSLDFDSPENYELCNNWYTLAKDVPPKN